MSIVMHLMHSNPNIGQHVGRNLFCIWLPFGKCSGLKTRFQQAFSYQDMTLILRSQIKINHGDEYNRLLQSSD